MRPAIWILLLAVVPFAFAQQDQPKKKPFPPKSKDQILKTFREEFIDLTPGQGKYPASFTMGSDKDGHANEKPAHKVTFSKPFAMAKYEITQELYLAVMGNNPSKWQGHRNAVELVTWAEANEFCKKATADLRQQKLIGADDVVRLPSEAEWEYACRAGTTTTYSHGDDLENLGIYCWYKGNSKGFDPPVGEKKGNPWTFYDMHGYNWEWVADAYHASYEGAPTDGKAREDAKVKERVIRGGSWADPADASRSAFRKGVGAEVKNDTLGFRCVLEKK